MQYFNVTITEIFPLLFNIVISSLSVIFFMIVKIHLSTSIMMAIIMLKIIVITIIMFIFGFILIKSLAKCSFIALFYVYLNHPHPYNNYINVCYYDAIAKAKPMNILRLITISADVYDFDYVVG